VLSDRSLNLIWSQNEQISDNSGSAAILVQSGRDRLAEGEGESGGEGAQGDKIMLDTRPVCNVPG
jgi:hypothetical protein